MAFARKAYDNLFKNHEIVGGISPTYIFKIFNVNASLFHVRCLAPVSTHGPTQPPPSHCRL